MEERAVKRTERIRGLERTFPGWTVSVTKGGHIKLRNNRTGAVVFAAATPSDHRADRNLAAQVRRAERIKARKREAKEKAQKQIKSWLYQGTLTKADLRRLAA